MAYTVGIYIRDDEDAPGTETVWVVNVLETRQEAEDWALDMCAHVDDAWGITPERLEERP